MHTLSDRVALCCSRNHDYTLIQHSRTSCSTYKQSRLCAIEQFRKSLIADSHVEMEKQRMGSVCLQYVMLNALMVTYRLGI